MVDGNLNKYNQHNVVTQVKTVQVEALVFPTITFCLQEYNYTYHTLNGTPNLAESFKAINWSNLPIKSTFEGEPCNIHNDFEYFPMYYHFETIELTLSCYKFNAGKNAALLKSTQFEAYSGLTVLIELEKKQLNFISCW